MFEKAFVINLPFKDDRLDRFLTNAPKCLGKINVWPAVHGDTVLHPNWWTAGCGAWGCYRSHMGILEHCYNSGVESYVVFEDDAIFRPDFEASLTGFLTALPHDWEQVYLGGQLLYEVAHPPIQINERCFIPYNVNRTHCFAVHKRGYDKLYRHLNATPFHDGEHIDHHLGRLHESGAIRVYVPSRWMVGQDAGPSNISGNMNGPMYWGDPERVASPPPSDSKIPVVFLEASMDVALELARRGWHRGYWLTSEQLDYGVSQAMLAPDCRPGLREWYDAVRPEAIRDGAQCVCLYHPALTPAHVESLDFAKFLHIQALTAEEAEAALGRTADLKVRAFKENPVRHLIYCIDSKADGAFLRWSAGQLSRRIDLFDGVRSVCVLTDNCDELRAAQQAFRGLRIDHWIHGLNGATRDGIAIAMQALLKTVPRHDGVTFYGCVKSGTTTTDPDLQSRWGLQYQVGLDDWSSIREFLEKHSVAGTFYDLNDPVVSSRAHSAAAEPFFWFHNADFFSTIACGEVSAIDFRTAFRRGNRFAAESIRSLYDRDFGCLREDATAEERADWQAKWQPTQLYSESRPRAISVIVPTTGSPSLKATIQSLQMQLGVTDEIIIVADNPETCQAIQTRGLVDVDCRLVACDGSPPPNMNLQRNHGMSIASGEILWFCRETDTVMPRAIESIRETMSQVREPTIFRMRRGNDIAWRSHSIEDGNVEAPQMVVPNVRDLPRFPAAANDDQPADVTWLKAVADKLPTHWSTVVLYDCETAESAVAR